VQVYYQFENEERSGLGMPMPAGVVRVYQTDSTGGVQFVGEDRIDHTPKDETLNVKIGNAFDVMASASRSISKILAATPTRSNTRLHCAITNLCRLPSR